MATSIQGIPCGNCVFYNDFDSANLARVEPITSVNGAEDGSEIEGKTSKTSENVPDYEFNVWTKHDCQGTEYQNTNRTWFYFGIKAPIQNALVKLNILNLNRQSKMFSQGMCPVFKVVPGHPNWERIRDKPSYHMDQKGSEFTLSFTIRTPENLKAITFLAFTYPFTYTDLQHYLAKIDARMSKQIVSSNDDIYYHRECAIKSLEDRRLDVLTISSFHNISTEREERLNRMFPDAEEERALKFRGKRVIFVSARVHPGETPSSFVFNGFLNFILNRDDPIAIILRRIYVFKLIPMLNPDGVARGHYRMDTRGVNLNRVYLDPSPVDHPTIFAARNLIRYYHNFYVVPEETPNESSSSVTLEVTKHGIEILSPNEENQMESPLKFVNENGGGKIVGSEPVCSESMNNGTLDEKSDMDDCCNNSTLTAVGIGEIPMSSEDSGLFLYVDLHGHASKKGVFMYGNYFDDPDDTIMCMLLPKLMSINNPNFHFTSCNFAEKNMYLIDKRDGMSREGSGRVAVYKMTGLIRSYTLECNYNSGRLVNTVPARVRDGSAKLQGHMFVPPKYTPTVFEEVGSALGPSILDMTNSNPNSRLPNSQYRSLRGVKSHLKLTYVNSLTGTISRPRLKPISNVDNLGILKEAACLDEFIAVINNSSTTPDIQKSDNVQTTKSAKMRRTVSLYSAVKRIKSGRKNARQVAGNRKSLKNSRMNNVENGQVVSKIRSSRRSIKATVQKSLHTLNKRQRKKSPKHLIEASSIIKKGTKRLKVVSQKILKTRLEVGESSKTSSNEETRKKRVKPGTFTRLKRQTGTSEQTKQRKSSRINLKV